MSLGGKLPELGVPNCLKLPAGRNSITSPIALGHLTIPCIETTDGLAAALRICSSFLTLKEEHRWKVLIISHVSRQKVYKFYR